MTNPTPKPKRKKSGGRPKGQANKITRLAREHLQLILSDQWDKLEKSLNRLAKSTPKAHAAAVARLLPYVTPTYAAVAYADLSSALNVKSMSDDQLASVCESAADALERLPLAALPAEPIESATPVAVSNDPLPDQPIASEKMIAGRSPLSTFTAPMRDPVPEPALDLSSFPRVDPPGGTFGFPAPAAPSSALADIAPRAAPASVTVPGIELSAGHHTVDGKHVTVAAYGPGTDRGFLALSVGRHVVDGVIVMIPPAGGLRMAVGE